MLVLGGRVSGDQSEFQGGRKGPKKNLDGAALQQRRREWDDFNQYLERPDSKLDAIVDGANVGYYETNYAGAPKHVDYQQIDWIVQHFVDKKEKGMLRGRRVQSQCVAYKVPHTSHKSTLQYPLFWQCWCS
jgi:hypothetical protein